MTNSFLAFGALVTFGWLFANVPLPEPTSRSADSKAATTQSAVVSYAVVDRNIVEARRAPVPLIRNVRPPAATSPEAPILDSEAQAQDELDKRAAKAAVEADGYKRASVLGKGSGGTWRAKAYRGTTEVRLTVDGTGRVSME